MIWPPPPRALEGSIVRMEPLGPEHREGLREAAADPEIWTWMDRRIPVEEGAFDRWFETRAGGLRARATSGAVRDHLDRRRASRSAARPTSTVRPEHDGARDRLDLAQPRAWRTGANREAKLLMLALRLRRLGCMRVEFKTDARNDRSREALEALGATFEGIFRNHMLMPVTGRRDSAYYSITDEDWPAVRAARGLSVLGRAARA